LRRYFLKLFAVAGRSPVSLGNELILYKSTACAQKGTEISHYSRDPLQVHQAAVSRIRQGKRPDNVAMQTTIRQ